MWIAVALVRTPLFGIRTSRLSNFVQFREHSFTYAPVRNGLIITSCCILGSTSYTAFGFGTQSTHLALIVSGTNTMLSLPKLPPHLCTWLVDLHRHCYLTEAQIRGSHLGRLQNQGHSSGRCCSLVYR